MGPHTHESQPHGRKRWVYFEGSTALKQGQGVCYNRDYTGDGAAEWEGRRDVRVELPTNTNNRWFAGVAAQDYQAKTGGQWVEIWLPGSVCNVLCGVDTTVASTRMTCSAGEGDPGWFTQAGFPGRGSALALQTTTAGLIDSNLDGGGTASYAAGTGLTTITDADVGTTLGYVDAAVDISTYKCVVVAGADDATGGSATTGELAVLGVYDCYQATGANTFTIVGDTGDCDLAYYITDGYPTCLARLEDGDESGLQEIITPQDAVAVSSMVGGVTFVAGGWTMAADSTYTLADGTIPGEKKMFKGLGTLTTKDYKVTVTHGKQQTVQDVVAGTTGLSDGSPKALASFLIDAADEMVMLEWGGINWREVDSSGATLNAS